MEEKNFTLELKKILRTRQIRQKELADMVGVMPTTISNILNGRDRLGKKQAIRWGEALGIDPLWLMTQGEQGVNPNDGDAPTTTYTARYTWATLAASIDTPIEVISQALGHTYGQAVTLGYIMPDRRKVDEANKAVLALLPGTDAAKQA